MTTASRARFDRAAEGVRSEFRRHDRDSILYTALGLLQRRWPDAKTELEQKPWLTAVLVKWACLDGAMPRRERPPIAERRFVELREALWDAVEELSHDENLPLPALIRRLYNAQHRFQTYRSRTVLIDPILIGRLETTHTMRRLFRERVGIDEETFIDLALFFQSPIHRGTLDLDLENFADVLSYPPAAIDTFLRFLGRNPNALVASIRETENVRRRQPLELLEFPVLARYPFLRDGTVYRCWHPMLYHHGIAECVHHALMQGDRDRYATKYGRVLEAHVTELAKNAGGRWLSENELLRALPLGNQVVEGLISYDDANVLIECKGGLYPPLAITADRANMLATKTRALTKAIAQGWATSEGVRTRGVAPAAVRAADREYLLIVTNRELLIGTGRQLRGLSPESKIEPPSGDVCLLITSS